MIDKSDIFPSVKKLIIALRKHQNPEANWTQFKTIIERNTTAVCKNLNTRWLVSIADTYIDYGNSVERRNAMYISLIADFEKLWATKLLMYDIEFNNQKLKKLKKNAVIPLWDGMYSFNINHGDMVNNLFGRLTALMKETPALLQIYNTVLTRLTDDKNSTLGTLAVYHKNLLASPKKRSISKTIIRKIRSIYKQYRLFYF